MSINAVSLAGNDPYRISVDYEVPTKSIQYGNIILDSIASQFDGVATSFALKKDNNAYTPGNAQQLIVILGNDAQKPDQDYVVSGTNIVFKKAPAAYTTLSIVALATTADLTRTLNYVVDSGNLAMTPGDKGFITLDVSGVIEQLVIYSEQQGDLVLDIQKADFTTYPTFTSILGGGNIQMINNTKLKDDVLTNWNTTIVAGDLLQFDVVSVSNITRFLISLKLKL